MSLADLQWCPTSVQVTVLQARGLRVKGKGGTNDAYAVMHLGKEKYQTSVVEKSIAPVWREEAAFDLPPLLLLHQGGAGGGGGGGGAGAGERGTLRVHVLHRALVGPDKQLGQAVINLLQLSDDKTRSKSEWFKLLDKTGKADKDRGEVLVDIQFMRNNMTASMFDLSAAGKSRSRLGKLKDKVRGKKKDSDAATGLVPSFSHVLTDSEGEAIGDEEMAEGKDEKKKKHKMKSLFSSKSNLQKNMSQSMSVLPVKNSSLSGSQSSGLNMDFSEGKKKFKFKIPKRSGSSDGKDSSSSHQKHGAAEQSNLCINGSHVYREERQTRTSRVGSNFSLASSGHGSMEDVPESSLPSVESLQAVRQYSAWTEEEEEEETAEVDHLTEDMEEHRKDEEEMRKRKEDEDDRKREEAVERLAEQKRRQDEEERKRIEEEKVRQEEEERFRKQEEALERLAEEKRQEEEERKRIEEERVRREEEDRLRKQEEALERLAEKKRQEEEERKRIEEEKVRLEEEERLRKQEEALERLAEEKRRQEEERKRIEEEEKVRREEEQMILRKRGEEEEQVRREEQQQRERLEEEKKRGEEQERIRMKEEGVQKDRMREEERIRRREEECRLAQEKRRMEEERIIEEEKVTKEEERRRKEEEQMRRREVEECEAKRKLQDEEKKQLEEEKRIRKEEERRREEEERARKEKEEYERLAEERRKLGQKERERMEDEERIKREKDERMRMEEEKRREEEEAERVRSEVEEKRRLEEQERRIIAEAEKRKREEDERIMKEQEDRARKEKEEYEKLVEEKRKLEEQERRLKEEKERIRHEEEEKIRIEEERRRRAEDEERAKKKEVERLVEEKKRLEEQEKRRIEQEEKILREEEERKRRLEEAGREKREEEARRLETEKLKDAEVQKKKENTTKEGYKAAGKKLRVAEENPAGVTCTNPFDETGSNNPAPEVSKVKQGYPSAVSSVGSETRSTDQRDLIGAQRDKRPAPQPPRGSVAESPREQDVSKPHQAQTNKQSNDKDVKTASVLPQRSVQVIAPLSQSRTDMKNPQSSMQGAGGLAKHGKRPAPSRPSVEEELPSKPKSLSVSQGGVPETKQAPVVYSSNPFEDDEDEPTAQDDSPTPGSVHWPPAASQDAASQAKLKSSKMARAPAPPPTSSTLAQQNADGGHVTDAAGVAAPNKAAKQTRAPQPEVKIPAAVQDTSRKEPQPARAQSTAEVTGVKKEGPPATSRRLQPVKPLNPQEQKPAPVVQPEKNNNSTEIEKKSEVQDKTMILSQVNDSGPKGPYTQLTQKELISLVLKQEKQLSERDKTIAELELYIDNLLVRVIEESPGILMSLNSLKKSV